MASSEDLGHYTKPTPLHMLPMRHPWTSKTGVTLIGDAAHLMTPFAGECVNTAMLGALELAEEIIEAMKIRVESGDATEKKMFVRAEEKMRETYENLETIFAKDAPRGDESSWTASG